LKNKWNAHVVSKKASLVEGNKATRKERLEILYESKKKKNW
jgi:hypothetical protein